MSKNKKKKDADFQKVKLKVGRRIKRDTNETKAEFRSRKIVLKEVRSHSDNPITALTHHSDHISQHGKLSLLNHFNSALNPDIVKELTKPMVDSLAKFVIDHSDQVRAATYRCLKTCLNHMKQRGLPLKEFAYSVKPYLDCASTHIDRGISQNCLKFVDYLINTNEPQLFEPLMHVILRRYEAGNMSSKEMATAQKLKNFYLKCKFRENLEMEKKSDNIEPMIWTEINYFLDLDRTIHKLETPCLDLVNDDREVSIVPKAKVENIVEKFLQSIPDATSELEDLERPVQAKRFRSI